MKDFDSSFSRKNSGSAARKSKHVSFEKLSSHRKSFKRSYSAYNATKFYDSNLSEAAYIAIVNGVFDDSDGSSIYAGSDESIN